MRRNGWWIAVALVLLGNVVVLVGVGWNRSGEPDAVITLTERELPVAWQRDENTGIALRLELSGSVGRGRHSFRSPDWLDAAKLSALGFDCSAPVNAETRAFHYAKQLPRDGFIVLEYDGEAWASWLTAEEEHIENEAARVERGEQTTTAVEELRERLEGARIGDSRLFAIDAGLDPDSLRARYPDRSRYLVMPAVFSIWTEDTEIHGRIRQILGDTIHVSRQHRATFDELEGGSADIEATGPRYEVTLHLGRRHEPWIDDVS